MPNNMILLETIALTQSAASVTFDNLPTSGYTDLKVVYSARTTAAARDDFFKVQLNGSSSNFSAKVLYGSGSGAASFSDTSGYVGAIDAANATANTFNNGEFYLPNYRSTNAKSFSVDTVQEDNQTQAFITMTAGLWNPGTQAAITSIAFVPNSGSFVANSTFSLYGIAAYGTTPVTAPKATGGNIIENDGTYWIHTFTSSGSFIPQTNLTCDYLVVAGGGGGGYEPSAGNQPGGGGAGGMRSTVTGTGGSGSLESPIAVTVQNYAITIGAGGSRGASGITASNGSDSIFSTITSAGGGRGVSVNAAGNDWNAAAAGGSGGGGGGGALTGGAASPSGQGFAGGTTATVAGYYGSGGGGAAAAGQSNTGSQTNTAGGAGRSTVISGTSKTYAKGGNGAQAGGTTGTANTGDGGNAGGTTTGGNGGSGIIIIRYPIAS